MFYLGGNSVYFIVGCFSATRCVKADSLVAYNSTKIYS